MEFFTEQWRESNDYRSAFFRRNRGFLGKLWVCSQCYLPLLGKEKVEVDHVIAPSRALFKGRSGKKRRNIFTAILNKLLLGTDNNNVLTTLLNTEMNTVPICPDCNKKKGNKMGMYMVKGWVARILTRVFHIAQDLVVFAVYFILLALHYLVKFLAKFAKKGGKSGFKFISRMRYGKLGMLIVLLVASIILATKYLR